VTRIPFIAACLLALSACSKSSDAPAGLGSGQPPAGAAAAADRAAPARPSEPPAGPTGRIRGTVKLTGTAPEMPPLQRGSDPVCGATPATAETVLVDGGGGLANAVVRVAPGTVPAWTPPGPLVVDQVDCMYRPRVQAGVVGQTLEVKNGDPTAHNVNARRLELGQRSDQETLFNRSQPRGSAPVTTALAEGVDVLKLKCDMHGWMQGYVVVSDNPYAAVSAADGGFAIADVPAGARTLEVWHELYGVKRVEITVAEGDEASVELSFDAVADRPASMGAAPAATAPTAPASTPGAR
jgi:hypothetical protein